MAYKLHITKANRMVISQKKLYKKGIIRYMTKTVIRLTDQRTTPIPRIGADFVNQPKFRENKRVCNALSGPSGCGQPCQWML